MYDSNRFHHGSDDTSLNVDKAVLISFMKSLNSFVDFDSYKDFFWIPVYLTECNVIAKSVLDCKNIAICQICLLLH